METKQMTDVQLVDKITEWEKLLNEGKAEIQKLESEIQGRGLAAMENRKVKTVQFFGSQKNYVLVQKAAKVNLIDYDSVKKVIGKIKTYIKVDYDPSYTLLKKFKIIASAIFMNDYEKRNVSEILDEIGLDEKLKKVALKKLKGDWVKDKALLEAMGVQDVDTWLFFIHQAINYQEIKEALKDYNGDFQEAIDKLKKSVLVEETVKIVPKYQGSE